MPKMGDNISDLLKAGSIKNLNEERVARALEGVTAGDVLDVFLGNANNDTKVRLNRYALDNGINISIYNALNDLIDTYGDEPQPPAPKPPCSPSLFSPLLFKNQLDGPSVKSQKIPMPRGTFYLNGTNVSLASLVLSTPDNVNLGTIVADNYISAYRNLSAYRN